MIDIFAIDNNKVVDDNKKIPTGREIFESLLSQIVPVDFNVLAHPKFNELRRRIEAGELSSDAIDSIPAGELRLSKLEDKHRLVVIIENLMCLASRLNWGLCKNNGMTYVYNTAYWMRVGEEELRAFLGEAAERMGVDHITSCYFRFRKNLLEQFMTSAYLNTPSFSRERIRINLRNGTFEIMPDRRGIREFDASDFLTYQLPFDYDPSAEAPMFHKYLERVLPDESCRKVLAEYIGYLFVGNQTLKAEKALLLYGSGANGKSVFFEIIMAMLGPENVCNYSLEQLTNDDKYQRAMIGDKLLNYASEISTRINVEVFKQLVSGEPLSARLPYGRPFILTDYAKLIFNCNELPRDIEQTHAFFRRLLIVPFKVTIPAEEQDRQLATKIARNELSGVFNWVLSGLDRLLTNKGFTPCEAVEQELAEYRKQTDSVRLFIDEMNYLPSVTASMKLKDIYDEYRGFCLESGMYPCRKGTFRERLSAQGIKSDKNRIGNIVYVQKAPME